jgi:queuosine precursor transporter
MMKITTSLSRNECLYLVCTTFFSVIVILSNLITAKLFQSPFIQGFALPSGLITYPLTFLISDLVTEIYGAAKARFMVYLGFAMGLFTHLIILMTLWLPPYDGILQQAFELVFGLNGIIFFSSIVAYAASQIIDVQLYSLLKRMTVGKHLWLRNNGSTLISQLVDTTIVCIGQLYFGFHMDLFNVLAIIMISYLYKACVSICNTPLFYLAVAMTKKMLHDNSPVLLGSELDSKA